MRLMRSRLAGVGVVLIGLLALSAILADVITVHTPTKQQVTNALQPPGATHWLGTDELGRDIFSRVVYGGRVSLAVGIAAVAVASAIGTMLGLVSGYWANTWIDQLIGRVMDALLSFPPLVLALAIVAGLGPAQAGEIPKAVYAIIIVAIPAYVRLTRGQVLTIRERDFVQGSRALGAQPPAIILRHILPNVISPLIVQASLGIATAMLTEAALSFLGLGVQPPTPSWGAMLSAGRGYLENDAWLVFGPGLAIFLAVLGFNFIGDGLRDVLDPSLRNR